MVAAMTLIALADILEALDERLAELDMDIEGKAASGLGSLLSGDDFVLYTHTHVQFISDFIENRAIHFYHQREQNMVQQNSL